VCIVVVAAKVNLIKNHDPVVVYINEYARCPELKTLILLGVYRPRAFVCVANHKQMWLTVLSAGRYYNNTLYVNPFQNQALLSMFKRLISAGQEHQLLTVQHRYKGDIPR
jgi:hypothetical protein